MTIIANTVTVTLIIIIIIPIDFHRLNQSRYERLGLLLLGCCPGGVGSNFWTAMLGGPPLIMINIQNDQNENCTLSGDINLSVTMTFFSSVAAFAMTSFWIWFLGSPLVDTTLPIPYTQLVFFIDVILIIVIVIVIIVTTIILTFGSGSCALPSWTSPTLTCSWCSLSPSSISTS